MASANMIPSLSDHMKPTVIATHDIAKMLNDNGVPIAAKLWDYLVDAKAKIDAGLDYTPPRPGWFRGLCAELSISPAYNPYKVCYTKIHRDNLNGWDARIRMLNSWSSTDYYMIRIAGEVYVVWLNASNEVLYIDLNWHSVLNVDDDEDAHEVNDEPPVEQFAGVIAITAQLPQVGQVVGAHAVVEDMDDAANDKKPP
jgi:hypothetical protein